MHDSREHILKTAFILFLKKSYKEVTLKEIVEKSGLSKGAFYHYFPSKEKLFHEIVDSFYFTGMKIDFDRFSKNSFYDFYHDILKYSITKFLGIKEFLEDTNDKDDITYYTLVLDAVNLFPRFNEKSKEVHAKELAGWEHAVQSAVDRGEIKSKMTARQIAQLFIYTSDGITPHLVLEGRIREVHHEIQALWDGIYNDLKV
jgi:AcrR family transcriptional regulator